MLCIGKLPSEVPEEVQELADQLAQVPQHVWLQELLEDAKLKYVEFQPQFEKPDRIREKAILRETRAPNDLEKYSDLFPQLPEEETRQALAIKEFAKDKNTNEEWANVDAAWDRIVKRFVVILGGRWVAKGMACSQYPYGFRSKENPTTKSRASTTSFERKWKKS